MTLEILQKEMIYALKSGNKFRKDVLSTLVGAVKKAGIDNQCRDNIPESLVDTILIKEQKTMQEMIDTCPVERAEMLNPKNRNRYSAEQREVIDEVMSLNLGADVMTAIDEAGRIQNDLDKNKNLNRRIKENYGSNPIAILMCVHHHTGTYG